MFEKVGEPVASKHIFRKRMLKSVAFGLLGIIIALGIGIVGFHYFEGAEWLEGFVNSAMILSTMGPIMVFKTQGGKIFAAFYALFSGLMFVTLMGVIFAPLIHRFLHTFHHESKKR